MNLLLLESSELEDGRATLEGPRADHVRTVLRAVPGQRLKIGVRGGNGGVAVVAGFEGERLLLEEVRCDVPPPPRAGVSLLLAMPRPKALRRILPAVASLGLDELVVVNAAHVDRAYLDSPILAESSVRRLFDLGLEQACDTRSPAFQLERRFRPFVEDVLPSRVESSSARWLLHPAPPPGPASVTGPGHRWLAVGPETGWTDFERELLAKAGFLSVSLGDRTLRVETVVPYAVGRLCPPPSVSAST